MEYRESVLVEIPINVALAELAVPKMASPTLAAVLWREAVHIVAEGIASVEDVDRSIRFGPGLRWAIDD